MDINKVINDVFKIVLNILFVFTKSYFDNIAPQIAEICTVANSLPLFLKYSAKSLFFNRLNPTDENLK